ncbi:MAG: Mammalian cell entry related domain protein [Pedosphaera sp.]|nr:Mammalian cell entry related domain protein [Pedosphaera sp.]
MSARPSNFKIGLFVIIGIGLLLAGLFAFGARSYFQERQVFETYVPGAVQGLSVGSPVKLRGVTIGKVTYVGFVWNEYPQFGTEYVLIVFEVPENRDLLPPATNILAMLKAKIAQGLRARVQGQGITGTSILALDYLDPVRNPPLQVPWTPKHHYIPSAPGQFTEMLASIEKTLRNFEKADFPAILAQLDKVLGSADQLVTNVDRVDFDKLGTNATALVAELRDTNTRLRTTLAEAQAAITGTDLPALGRNTQAMEDRLSRLAIELHRVAAGLDFGNQHETLANAREATEQLKALLSELKQQPSSILFSKPPPPAQSVETPSRK